MQERSQLGVSRRTYQLCKQACALSHGPRAVDEERLRVLTMSRRGGPAGVAAEELSGWRLGLDARARATDTSQSVCKVWLDAGGQTGRPYAGSRCRWRLQDAGGLGRAQRQVSLPACKVATRRRRRGRRRRRRGTARLTFGVFAARTVVQLSVGWRRRMRRGRPGLPAGWLLLGPGGAFARCAITASRPRPRESSRRDARRNGALASRRRFRDGCGGCTTARPRR